MGGAMHDLRAPLHSQVPRCPEDRNGVRQLAAAQACGSLLPRSSFDRAQQAAPSQSGSKLPYSKPVFSPGGRPQAGDGYSG